MDTRTDGELLIEMRMHLSIAAGIEAELAKHAKDTEH